jgi:hypothetical protein
MSNKLLIQKIDRFNKFAQDARTKALADHVITLWRATILATKNLLQKHPDSKSLHRIVTSFEPQNNTLETLKSSSYEDINAACDKLGTALGSAAFVAFPGNAGSGFDKITTEKFNTTYSPSDLVSQTWRAISALKENIKNNLPVNKKEEEPELLNPESVS